MITTADHFNRAMTLWFELTKMDPNATSWRGFEQIRLHGVNEELKASMEYDPSMITTYLLLDACSTDYFKQAKVSVADFNDDPDTVFDYMDKVREFQKLIRDPEIVEEANAFIEATRNALTKYDVPAEKIEAFFENKHDLAFIRRDALKSINRLRVDQFMEGELDPAGTVPIYNREVFGYWNVNSLINHLCSMPSGMSLNLIRDPDELHSYFTISVRNGGNLMVLTDIQEYAHPLGRYMSRRPDRTFEARTVRNWFPYDLLNIKYNDKGEPYHDIHRKSIEKGLVPHQTEHFVLTKFSELGVGEVVWATLVFDLIYDKYWKKPFKALPTSYTNEMIRLEDQGTLLAAATNANLLVVGYQPLNLPRLTHEDMRSENLDEKALGRRHKGWEDRYGSHRWMEDAYGHLVPEEALNLLGVSPDAHHYLAYHPEKEIKHRWKSDGPTQIVSVNDSEVKCLMHRQRSSFDGPFRDLDLQKNAIYALEKVDGTLFGTREQLDADRKFIARVNYVVGLQREADRAFERDRPEILRWFKEKVEANLDRFLAFAHYEEVERIRSKYATFGGTWLDGDNADKNTERYTFSTLNDQNRKLKSYEYSRYDSDWTLNYSQGWMQTGGFYRCYKTGAKSSYQLFIEPGSPADLAWMLDMKPEDLPVFLQHWNPGDDHYVGNSILDRIDPMEWKLDNPWDKVSFAVSFFLSKRAVAKIIKELPKPEIEDVSHCKYKGITRQNGRGRRSQIHHSNFNSSKYITGEDTKDAW